MPTALLAGAFGQGNLGDDALLRAFVGALPDWQLTVTTHDPAEAAALGCEPVRTSRPDSGGPRRRQGRRNRDRRRQHLQDDASGGGPAATRPLGQRGRPGRPVDAPGPSPRPGRGRRIRSARLDVPHPRPLHRPPIRPVGAAGRGVDRRVAQGGRTRPVPRGADPAWTLLRPPEARPSPDRSVLVVPSTYAVSADGWPGMVRRMADTVQHLIDAGLRVHVQVWQRRTPATPIDDERIVRAPGAPVRPQHRRLADAVLAGRRGARDVGHGNGALLPLPRPDRGCGGRRADGGRGP